MKRKSRFKDAVVQALEIPGELIFREPVLSVNGRHSVVVENYKCILKYTGDEITLRTFCGSLKICGKMLLIRSYTSEEICVEGVITAIFIEGR